VCMRTILVLSANPKGTHVLELEREVRDIQKALARSQHQDNFQLVHRADAQWKDFRREIQDLQPEIVHFSGHSAGKDGLIVEEDDGSMRGVPADALARLFKLFPCVKCVVLNACYSEVQAVSIHRHVPCVVGMSLSIGDRAARDFAEAFYDGLFAGRGYRDAYEMGLSGMANDVEVWTPVFKVKEEEKVEKPDVEVRLTRTQKSNQLEIARLEKDLAAVENELGMPLDVVREGRLQEQKKQLIHKIEMLEETLP
jgi:hypothetical protein